MILNRIAHLTLSISLLNLCAWANPTEIRAWKSTAGTAIEASATKVVSGKVSMKSADGRMLEVPMDKLSEEDRKFLVKHFGIKEAQPGDPKTSGVATVSDGLAHPIGQVSGPIDAGGGSHYYVYIPKTLRKWRDAPLMLHTGDDGGDADSARKYSEAAELAGWIMASSVESKGNDWKTNLGHAKRCVKHLLENLPIDKDRVYFTGESKGANMAFNNSRSINSVGTMPIIGYYTAGKLTGKQYCYGISGTRDTDRYATASAVALFEDRGFHRFHLGGHDPGPSWIGVEGILWLSGKYLGDRAQEPSLEGERMDFEASLIHWLNGLSVKEPHRAHCWCKFLTEEYKIRGANAPQVTKLLEKLNEDPTNARYTAGLAAIDAFSDGVYDTGNTVDAQTNHTTTAIQNGAENLAASFRGVPLIEEIAKDLGLPTARKGNSRTTAMPEEIFEEF